MKPKTTGGKTVPCPTQHDCDQLDRTIDLVLLYKQYQDDQEMRVAASVAVDSLRDIAGSCKALLKPEAQPPKT